METHHWWSRQHCFRHVAEYAHRKALDSLEKEGLLQDPLLKEALKKRHGYASQPGIRHGRQEGSIVNVGLDEAMVMDGACGSFAAYPAQKRQGKQKAMDAMGEHPGLIRNTLPIPMLQKAFRAKTLTPLVQQGFSKASTEPERGVASVSLMG